MRGDIIGMCNMCDDVDGYKKKKLKRETFQ